MVEETQETGRRADRAGGRSTPSRQRRDRRAQPAPPADPPRAGGLPPIMGSALAAAVLLVAGGGTFAGGYFTNAAVDDDDGGSGPGGGDRQRRPARRRRSGDAYAAGSGGHVSVDDDPSWGPTDAKVTVVEFSDFQCPYCGRFVSQTYSQIKQEYGGKVHFVFRDFPLSTIHPWAEKGAEAAGCANEQGKFWEYHDAIFQNQTTLTQTYQTAAAAVTRPLA